MKRILVMFVPDLVLQAHEFDDEQGGVDAALLKAMF